MLDGIDEALAMFAPRQLRLQRMTDPGKGVTFRVPGGTASTRGTGDVAAWVTAAHRKCTWASGAAPTFQAPPCSTATSTLRCVSSAVR